MMLTLINLLMMTAGDEKIIRDEMGSDKPDQRFSSNHIENSQFST
jgi:hypothetical protein